MSLADFKPMQERCSNCSFCKWIPYDKMQSIRFAQNCPAVVLYGFNTYSARGRFQMGLAIVNGEQEYTDKAAEITRSCLSCGSCDISCKICRYNLEPLEHNIELKHDAILAGKVSPEQKKLMDSLAAEQTMMPGMKKADRGSIVGALGFKDAVKEQCEVLFFPGCRYSYDESLSDTLKAAAKLLKACGADVGVLGSADVCCAGRAYQMGFIDEFEKKAADNVRLLKSTGAKVIVTPCADCFHTLTRLYGRFGLDIKVKHITEYLAEAAEKGELKFTHPVKCNVTYHDPCHLGRLGEPYVAWEGHEKKIFNQVHTWEPRRPRYNGAHGVYDAPRALIEATGAKLLEMERIREYSWCCGAGGGCSEVDVKLSDFAANERIEEAKASGAACLITACPWCRTNFKKAGGMEVKDILDLACEAL